MNVYIAGKWESKSRLIAVRDAIVGLGYTSTSEWLDEVSQAGPISDEMNQGKNERAQPLAWRDCYGVQRCDMFILDTQDINERGGREVEYGIALGARKTLVIVGPRRNVFHSICDAHFDDWDAALAWLHESR